jgi:hypothetical protein
MQFVQVAVFKESFHGLRIRIEIYMLVVHSQAESMGTGEL